jgi:GH15 family glucan-1,4-alpha-glucosidase
MAGLIEDYALIGDTRTAGLVGRDGSIDWLCLPRFDSGACFAALLGTPEHGRFSIAPAGGIRRITRRYRGETLLLETDFETEDGAIRLTDFMPPGGDRPVVIRILRGLSGRVPVRLELVIRFNYGSLVPWVRRAEGALVAIAGPDGLALHTPVQTHGQDFRTVAEFVVAKGDRVPFTLSWFPSHEPIPHRPNPFRAERQSERWWTRWSSRCSYRGEWRDAVVRSLITLKALIHAPTGGVVAAPTTSLPEDIGGERNWDYRYCWLRDATSTLEALMAGGYEEEAAAWSDWLLRAVAGEPSKAQILYGVAGERDLPEFEVPWLPGYEGSRPVRVGNAALDEFQLDVYGELMDALLQTRRAGIREVRHAWDIQRVFMDFLESAWRREDKGLWEVRGPDRHFTHSKVMAWVAFDRTIQAAEEFSLQGPVERWRKVREEIRSEIEAKGYDDEVGSFVQFFGSKRPDASLLQIPLVGFLPASDPRVMGTVEAVERDLMRGGLVARYEPDEEVEGVSGDDGAFLPCTLWLADALELMGRRDEARLLFERVLALRNDVGLLSEEYDVDAGRLVGNFPQALSHLWLVLAARNLSGRPAGGRHAPFPESSALHSLGERPGER